MPNNILITPGSASIEFSGSAANNLKLQVLSNGNVAITGSIGKVAEFSNTGQVFITSSMQATQFTGSFGIIAFVGTASRVNDGAYLSEAQTFSALKTFSAGIALSDSNITGVGNITINDPGPNEGISWAGGNLWKIYESPNDLSTNSGGNLHIVENTTRRATFNTSGQLEIPIATGTAPFVVSSTTTVTNLSADLLDGYNQDTANTANTIVRRDGSGNFSAGTITAYLSGYADHVDSNDTRATNDTPASRNSGVYFDFKQNSTNGLSDGGTYNGQMTWRSYGSGTDLSGGQPIQIAYTANSRIWTRIGTGTTTWASWRQLLDSVSQVYAYNMDQNVRTTDSPTFAGATFTGTVNVNAGNQIYLRTSAGNLRGYIQATDTDDAHLIIATSGGEDITFRDGGTGGGTNFVIRGDGAVEAYGSATAPIFYDSTTAYYADFSSTGTSINIQGSLRAATYNKPAILSVASGTSSTGGSLAIQQETGEGWTGVFVDYEPYTGWGLWHDNPNNYFSFTAEASTGQIRSFTVPSRVSGNRTAYEKFRIDQNNGDVIIGRDGYAQSSLRAPIFYDNPNTAYYVDPASTSVLNTLTVGGWQVAQYLTISVTAGNWYTIATNPGNRAMATFHTWDYDSGLHHHQKFNAGVHFGSTGGTVLTVLGKSWYSGGGVTGNIRIRGTGTYDTHYLQIYANYTGTLYIAMTDNYHSSGWTLVNGGTGSPGASTFAEVNPNYRGLITNGAIYSGEAVYAPIFYDANDANFYLDPNSTTVIRYFKMLTGGSSSATRALTIRAEGQSEINFGSYPASWTSALQIQNNNNTDFVWISPLDDGYNARFRTGGSGLDFYTDGGNDTGTYSGFIGSGYIQGISSVRGPIFYDSNDTTYFVDPSTTGISINLRGAVRITDYVSPNGYPNWSDVVWMGRYDSSQTGYPMYSPNEMFGIHFQRSSDGASIGMVTRGGSYNDYNFVINWGDDGGDILEYRFNNSRVALMDIGGQMYSPIYYDFNNSGYYCDPNGTSRLNNATTDESYTYGWFRNYTSGHGLYNQAQGTHWYSNNGYWKAGAGGNGYGGVVLYQNYESSLRGYLYWDGGGFGLLNSSGNWQLRIEYGNANMELYRVTWANDMRAYIYYDRDDTTYYMNPAGYSYLGSSNGPVLEMVKWGSAPGNNTTLLVRNNYGNHSWGIVAEFRVEANGGSDRPSILFSSGYNSWTWSVGYGYADDNFRINQNHGWRNGSWGSTRFLIDTGSTTYIYGTLQVDFIYDRNNTGYYVNPESVTQLNYVLANNWFRPQGCTGVYWESYGRGIWSPECEGNPYGHIATYGGGRNGWYGYGIGSRWTLMSTVGDNIGVHDNSRGNWLWYWDGGYTRWNLGYNYFAGDVRSWRFYDHDTGYYGDFNSETNWQGLTTRSKAQIGLTGRTNWKRPDITGDGGYWTGVMGWGTRDLYEIMDWGSGFFDTWSNPSNQPAGTSHWLGIQSFHYSAGYNYAYGWQLVGGPIDGAWWKSSWPYSRPWRKVAMYELNEYSYSFWSTIMYDANNGGYYIDPDGGSRLNVIYPNEIYNYGWFRNQNSGQGMYNQSTGMHWYSNNGYWKSAGGGYGYGGIVMYNNYESDLRGFAGYWDGSGFGMLNSSGNWQIRIEYGNANMEVYRLTWMNDIRPYIIYDRNDSYYQLDPSGYSRNNQFSAFTFANNYSVSTDHQFGLRFDNSVYDTAYAFFREGGGWGYPYPDVRLAFHTGIKMGANGPSYEGIRIYDDYPMSSILIQLNGGSNYSFWYTWQNLTGYHGIYSGLNSAHFYPNNISYGSWRIDGSRNGWQGIQFDSRIALMMNQTVHGFHSDYYGWRLYLDGYLYCPGDIVAFWSDRRLKEDIRPLQDGEGLETILKLIPSRFKWKQDALQVSDQIPVGREDVNLIAQEVQEVLPAAVIVNKAGNKMSPTTGEKLTDYLTVNHDKISPYLIQAIKDLKAELEELKQQLKKAG